MKLCDVSELMIKENWREELRSVVNESPEDEEFRSIVDEAIEDYDTLEKEPNAYKKLRKIDGWLEKYEIPAIGGKVVYDTLRDEFEQLQGVMIEVKELSVKLQTGPLLIWMYFKNNFMISTLDLSRNPILSENRLEPSQKKRILASIYREKKEGKHGRIWLAKKLYSNNKINDKAKSLRDKRQMFVDALKAAPLYEEEIVVAHYECKEYDDYLVRRKEAEITNLEMTQERTERMQSSGLENFLENFQKRGFPIYGNGVFYKRERA